MNQKKYLSELFLSPDSVREVRVFMPAEKNGFRPVYSGYYQGDRCDKLLSDLAPLSNALGVYITINPVIADALLRRPNQLARCGAKEAVSNKEILRREWLFVDIDPVRISGISSRCKVKTSRSNRLINPRLGLWAKYINFNMEDLPAPLGPVTKRNAPCSRLNEISLRTSGPAP